MTSEIDLVELEPPKFETPYNRQLLVEAGEYIEPIARLATFDPAKFERIVFHVVFEFLRSKEGYVKVRTFAGANDRGRDIIANKCDGSQDIYQCKHYDHPLQPAEMYVEFGKIIFYSYKQIIQAPSKYYIVSPRGIGPKLAEIIDSPDILKENLVKNWDSHCKSRISEKESIELSGDFRLFFDEFDLSIIEDISPDDLIEMHSKTKFYPLIFGGGLNKRVMPDVPEEPQEEESVYIGQMLAAFSDREGKDIPSYRLLNKNSLRLFTVYRTSFFRADALRVFARDNLLDETDFESFIEAIGISIETKLYAASGIFNRMSEVINHASLVSIENNPLKHSIGPDDKIGACHHLVNRGKISWTD